MTGQRTLATLLAVIAVLLAAHLLVRLGDQEAQAEHLPPPDFLSAAPTVVAGEAFPAAGLDVSNRIYRFWSDGTVDVSVVHTTSSISCAPHPNFQDCGPEVIIDPGP